MKRIHLKIGERPTTFRGRTGDIVRRRANALCGETPSLQKATTDAAKVTCRNCLRQMEVTGNDRILDVGLVEWAPEWSPARPCSRVAWVRAVALAGPGASPDAIVQVARLLDAEAE